MKFIRFTAKTGVFSFRLAAHEQMILRALLAEYPALRGARSPIQPGEDEKVAGQQQLLEECLDERRKQMRLELDEFLTSGERLKPDPRVKETWLLRLDAHGIDWMLEILNDVRVGNWVALGKPDPQERIELTSMEQMRHASAMEVCGILQSLLLHAVDRQLNLPEGAEKKKSAEEKGASKKAPAKTSRPKKRKPPENIE